MIYYYLEIQNWIPLKQGYHNNNNIVKRQRSKSILKYLAIRTCVYDRNM